MSNIFSFQFILNSTSSNTSYITALPVIEAGDKVVSIVQIGRAINVSNTSTGPTPPFPPFIDLETSEDVSSAFGSFIPLDNHILVANGDISGNSAASITPTIYTIFQGTFQRD